jgi:hypothetical protein
VGVHRWGATAHVERRAQVEELRIRTELEAERERQFVKLSSLLDDITDTEKCVYPSSCSTTHVLSGRQTC